MKNEIKYSDLSLVIPLKYDIFPRICISFDSQDISGMLLLEIRDI